MYPFKSSCKYMLIYLHILCQIYLNKLIRIMFTYKSLLWFSMRPIYHQNSCAYESLGRYLFNLIYYDSRQGQRKWWLSVEINNYLIYSKWFAASFLSLNRSSLPYTFCAVRKVIYKISVKVLLVLQWFIKGTRQSFSKCWASSCNGVGTMPRKLKSDFSMQVACLEAVPSEPLRVKVCCSIDLYICGVDNL